MNDAKTYSDDKKEHKRIMKKLEDEKMRVRELLKDELGIRIGIVSGELGKAPKCMNKVYFITLCLYIVCKFPKSFSLTCNPKPAGQ